MVRSQQQPVCSLSDMVANLKMQVSCFIDRLGFKVACKRLVLFDTACQLRSCGFCVGVFWIHVDAKALASTDRSVFLYRFRWRQVSVWCELL